MEPKVLNPVTAEFLAGLSWPGNVRQLENTCRWLTVMASGREILLADLPPELADQAGSVPADNDTGMNWQAGLQRWVEAELGQGHSDVLATAVPDFEKVMIRVALAHTGGRRKDAAELLGWGRNTLTRKIKELAMEDV